MEKWNFLEKWRALPKEERLESGLILTVCALVSVIVVGFTRYELKLAGKDNRITELEDANRNEHRRHEASETACYRQSAQKIERLTDKVIEMNQEVEDLKQNK